MVNRPLVAYAVALQHIAVLSGDTTPVDAEVLGLLPEYRGKQFSWLALLWFYACLIRECWLAERQATRNLLKAGYSLCQVLEVLSAARWLARQAGERVNAHT